jgi:hypothetical protein
MARVEDQSMARQWPGDGMPSRRDALAAVLALVGVSAAGTSSAIAAGAPAGDPVRGAPLRGLRIYTLSDGETHLEEVELPFLDPTGPIVAWERADYFRMNTLHAGWFTAKLHRSGSQHKLLVMLRGEAVLVASDGSNALVTPGTFVFGEDITGRGHTGRVISPDGAAVLEIGITMPRTRFPG